MVWGMGPMSGRTMTPRTAPIALASVALAVGIAVPAAAAALPQDAAFAAGGANLLVSWPPDPATFVHEEEPAAAAACGAGGPGPNLGGACFDVSSIPDGRAAEVTVTPTGAGSAGSVAFAAGFDVDGDGCVGCTAVDVLEQEVDRMLVDVPSGSDTLAVFVYGLQYHHEDFTPAPYRAVTGTITVDGPIGGSGDGGSGSVLVPSPPATDAKPHVCMPDCRLAGASSAP